MVLTDLPDCAWLGYRNWQGCGATLRLAAGAQQPVEPLTVTFVRDYLKLDSDPAEGDLLKGLIAAARSQAELLQRRVLVSKQFDLLMDSWPGGEIRLATPTTSVDAVTVRDASGETHDLTADTDYVADIRKEPGILMPVRGRNWPSFTLWPASPITVRFTAGYAESDPFWTVGSGSRIRQGMLMLVAGWHSNRMPYAVGQSAIAEYPFAVTTLLTSGAKARVL